MYSLCLVNYQPLVFKQAKAPYEASVVAFDFSTAMSALDGEENANFYL